MISKDRRYLYAFQGFMNPDTAPQPMRMRHSEALTTIERLDLTNESLGWQEISVNDTESIPIELDPKGCFIMYPLSEVKPFGKVHAPKEFDDKFLIFGGWKPYQNLPDIKMLDHSSMQMVDVPKFAKKLKSKQKLIASASTKRESVLSSSSSNSDAPLSDSDMIAEEHDYPEQPEPTTEALR